MVTQAQNPTIQEACECESSLGNRVTLCLKNPWLNYSSKFLDSFTTLLLAKCCSLPLSSEHLSVLQRLVPSLQLLWNFFQIHRKKQPLDSRFSPLWVGHFCGGNPLCALVSLPRILPVVQWFSKELYNLLSHACIALHDQMTKGFCRCG